MAHYYENPEVESNPRIITFHYRDMPLTFLSDSGVFSKDRVDYGTRVLLNVMPVLEDVAVLDVGCGYGVIGLALAKAGRNVSLTMVDVNERALKLAQENAQRLEVACEVYQSDAYEHVTGKYDWIVTNPPIRAGKKVVFEILAGAYDHLSENGKIVTVIQKKQGAPSAMKKLEEVFHNVEVLKRDKGYYVLMSKR